MTLWNSLTPDQQAAAIGGVVTVLFYAFRYIAPSWFENADSVAKWQRTLAAVLICGVAVLGKTLAVGWTGAGAFLVAWAIAYMTSEAAHTVAARTSALR